MGGVATCFSLIQRECDGHLHAASILLPLRNGMMTASNLLYSSLHTVCVMDASIILILL